jgi:hypothetical protein
MHGNDEKQIEVFSFIPFKDRIPAKHPIRPFKAMMNEILRDMDAALDAIYSDSGRPSIAPSTFSGHPSSRSFTQSEANASSWRRSRSISFPDDS